MGICDTNNNIKGTSIPQIIIENDNKDKEKIKGMEYKK